MINGSDEATLRVRQSVQSQATNANEVAPSENVTIMIEVTNVRSAGPTISSAKM